MRTSPRATGSYTAPGQTIRYESIAARVGQSPVYPDEEFRTVLSAFERGDSAEFERRLSVLFTACYSQSVQFGLSAVSHLLVELYRCLPPAMQAEGDLVGVSTQLGECDHISQQMRIIRSFGLNAIEGRLSGAQPEHYKDQFSVIMGYVAEHYTNPDLSITALAEHAGLSANTVRMLFRENGLSPPKKGLHSEAAHGVRLPAAGDNRPFRQGDRRARGLRGEPVLLSGVQKIYGQDRV